MLKQFGLNPEQNQRIWYREEAPSQANACFQLLIVHKKCEGQQVGWHHQKVLGIEGKTARNCQEVFHGVL